MQRAYENGPTKDVILECFKPRKLGPRASGSRLLGFELSPEKKKLDLGVVLGCQFKPFVTSFAENRVSGDV